MPPWRDGETETSAQKAGECSVRCRGVGVLELLQRKAERITGGRFRLSARHKKNIWLGQGRSRHKTGEGPVSTNRGQDPQASGQWAQQSNKQLA